MKYFWIPILLLFIACKKQGTDNTVNSKKIYFDLSKVVQNDIYNNQTHQISETKNITINGKHETKIIDTVDWKNELTILNDCDINKPDWAGKYTVLQFKDKHQVCYTANTSKLPVQKITVQFKPNDSIPERIEIEKKIGNFLFSNEQNIVYFPQQYFKVNASQRAVFMQDFNSQVEVIFNHKP